MSAIVKYLLQDYIRSYLFVPPVVVFIGWTIVSYTYVPNPVISSYAVSVTVLYLITAWLTITLMDAEGTIQLQITSLHAKSFLKVLCAKVLAILVFSGFLSLFALLYPVVIGAFHRQVTWTEGIIIFVSHVLMSLLAVAVTGYFSRIYRPRTLLSWLLLTLILVASLVRGGLENALPAAASLVVRVLPPSFPLLNTLGEETVTFHTVLVFVWLYALLYSLLLFILFYKLIENRKFIR
ncbi:hypothetical protein SAMN05421736_101493 [Evansella caseinilytica]|uniref:Uncharacterized protein n=1 Tax=Evansella caseinilytica TaxID=1503961 RepID=A0A1H3HHD3_9BACI|nr:hypothetical protein [Evansella caseinilytica]SDY14635.1 hypothetical protein SAMN05421736_101493 [Evansella caseinilytica]